LCCTWLLGRRIDLPKQGPEDEADDRDKGDTGNDTTLPPTGLTTPGPR
jgi:hypothetical protein